MRPSTLTTRTAATVIGVLFLAADAAGAAGHLVGGRLVSAPVDVARSRHTGTGWSAPRC